MEKATSSQRSDRPRLSADGKHVIFRGVYHRFTEGPAHPLRDTKKRYNKNAWRKLQLELEAGRLL